MKFPSQFYILCLLVITGIVTGQEDEDDLNPKKKFSIASIDFTLKLLKHVEPKYNTSNIIISPASISILLSVLQQGAKGNTADELEQFLQLTKEESIDGFKGISDLKSEKNVTLKWGNRCYIKPGLDLNNDFKNVIQENLDVGVEEIDFGVPSPQDSSDKINNWVKEVTNNHITDLVQPGTVSEQTIMVLINAIFFKGNWLSPFKKGKTLEKKFESSLDTSFQTLFMSQREKFYSDKDSEIEAKWVQLPFENKRFTMIFILPLKRHGLSRLLNKLTAKDLHQIFTNRRIHHVKLRIPKFKLSEKVSLVETLSELGLSKMFTSSADFGGMSPFAKNLAVSDMIHQANIEIDEKGSTGSAATVVQFLRMGTPNLAFVADQPFLFFLIEKENEIPLFAGKVVNPNPKS